MRINAGLLLPWFATLAAILCAGGVYLGLLVGLPMSWSDFFAMGGYALYVWGSYLVTFGALCAEIVLLASRRRSALDDETASSDIFL
jgi:heme exporter protein D